MTTGERLIGGTARLVVSDDGAALTVAAYVGAERITAVVIDPVRAIGLAAELAAAAHRHFARGDVEAMSAKRGGDRHASRRAERDEALRTLGTLIAAEAAPEQQARHIADRLARFRPMAKETAPERALMQQIVDSGLPLPKPDRLGRILRGR